MVSEKKKDTASRPGKATRKIRVLKPEEDYRCTATRDPEGRVLPGNFPSGSNYDIAPKDLSLAEERALDTLRHHLAAENDSDLRARLWAWDIIEHQARSFAQGPAEREKTINGVPLTTEDVAALDTIVGLWNKRTQEHRETFAQWDAKGLP